MNKEKLFEKYRKMYKNYLYGKCCYDDVFKILDKINSNTSKEADSVNDIKSIVHSNTLRVNNIEEEVKEEYEKEVVNPLMEELLDFLQFKGMIKSVQYKKRAEDLKKKLKKCDGVYAIRLRALLKFFNSSKIGTKYDDYRKINLILRLGALDTRDL